MTNGSRNFSRFLIVIAVAGLIPTLVLARFQFIEFDGWWHLFTATQDRWLILLGEWKYEAHPPLYYLLLRLVSKIGHSHLILRSISLVCGGLGTYVIGMVAARLYRHQASALLAAAAYAFAWNTIEINCGVRGYAMALLFVLLAFSAYVDWTRDPSGPASGRAVLRFGIYSLLAILSEYYVVFFLVGCLSLLILRVLVRPAFRAAFLHSIRVDWKAWLFSTVSITGLYLGLFLFHMVVRVQDQPYLAAYYWKEDLPIGLDGFLLSNVAKEIALFTPFALDPAIVLAFLALLFLPALLYFAFVRKGRWRGSLSADPPLLVAGMLAMIAVLSLAAKYPFGGELRQQSILIPFVFLTAFLLLDRLVDALRAPAAQTALFTAVGVLAAASFAYGWAVYPWNSVELNSAEYARFRTLFPTPAAVYGDVTSLVFFYAQKPDAKWTFEDRYIAEGQRIAVYQVDDGTGHPLRVLRNKRESFFDLASPETYRVLAAVLQHENLKSAILFYEGLTWDAVGAKVLEDRFRALAPLAGLDYGRYSFGTSYAFIEFKLR